MLRTMRCAFTTVLLLAGQTHATELGDRLCSGADKLFTGAYARCECWDWMNGQKRWAPGCTAARVLFPALTTPEPDKTPSKSPPAADVRAEKPGAERPTQPKLQGIVRTSAEGFIMSALTESTARRYIDALEDGAKAQRELAEAMRSLAEAMRAQSCQPLRVP